MNIAMRKNKRGKVPGLYDRQAPAPFNGQISPVDIADPFSPSDRNDRILVTRSIRDDPLGRLHARSQIDEVQYLAGRRWQALYEAVEIGGARGVDPTREAVDGGRGAVDGLTDARRKAAKQLATSDAMLGKEGKQLVRMVLGDRKFPRDVAVIWGDVSEKSVNYVTRRLRECLDTLATTV